MFIHLRAHSEFSLIDGLLSVDDLVSLAEKNTMFAVGLTDRVNLFGYVKFYKAAMAKKIKPIIGADFILLEDKSLFLFTALCKNDAGYANLRELISKAYLEGQVNDMPTVKREWIEKHRDGLIILSGARFGDIGKALLSQDDALAKQRLAEWTRLFPDHFYLEVQRTQRENEEVYLNSVIALAVQQQVPVVATNDVRFANHDDFEAHEARVCIQSSRVLNDPKRPKNYSAQQYFKSSKEMEVLFSDLPEALENTVEIAKRCSVKLTLGKAYLPQFPLPADVSLTQYITQQAEAGLVAHLKPTLQPTKIDQYHTRLKTELAVINSMGFAGYFLIVADFIAWAKRNNVPVGPGRGSGAGSLVAYCLGITGLDPLEHELLFERFLNPERVSMPDFDIDFCMDNRDRVIEYVADKYGHDAVSQIITYGTMAARAVVRDVGRVLGYPYGFVDKIAKLIPFEVGMTLEKALQQEEELSKLCESDGEVATLMQLAKKLEGLARSAGKHAGGVVIAPTKLTDFAPLYCEAGSTHIVTQFDKDDVEAVGLVKFDFLGLRTLTIIQWAVDAVNGVGIGDAGAFDINGIPLDDAATFTLMKSCATTAVFQLESRGMKDLIRRLQPDCFEDITALVALFRPGPLQSGMVDDFIDRKHGKQQVHYFHADIAPILKPTYGVILYQEQVMQIAQVLAGFSLGGADILRRAMGKKKADEMASLREKFVIGAKNRGVEEQVAAHIFDLMEKFAGYGFNKSHSAAYALLAYQTAYLKTHYPAQFMAAVLSSDMDKTEKVVGFYQECVAMGLTVFSPNVNAGAVQFSVQAGAIQYGLGAIKGVGEAAARLIVSEREKNGPYQNIFDFCARLNSHTVSRRTIEPLIYSGAMDVFGINRATLHASIDKAIKAADQRKKSEQQGQGDLFADVAEKTPDYVVISQENILEKLDKEKMVLGQYLSDHPIKMYEREITYFAPIKLGELMSQLGRSVTVAGLLLDVRRVFTKQGKRMAILRLEDRAGMIEVTVFNRLFETLSNKLHKNNLYVVHGKVEEDNFNQRVRMIAESVEALDEKRAQLAKRLVIFAESQLQAELLVSNLQMVIKPYQGGKCPVQVIYKTDIAKAKIDLGAEWAVHPKSTLLAQLKQLCGEAFVKVGY